MPPGASHITPSCILDGRSGQGASLIPSVRSVSWHPSGSAGATGGATLTCPSAVPRTATIRAPRAPAPDMESSVAGGARPVHAAWRRGLRPPIFGARIRVEVLPHRTAVWLGVLLGAVPGAAAGGRPHVDLLSFAYTSDHKKVLNKTDDWNDPATAVEKARIGVPAAPLPGQPGGGGVQAAPLASHTWGEIVRASATLQLSSSGGVDPATLKLAGASEIPAFRFSSAQAARRP